MRYTVVKSEYFCKEFFKRFKKVKNSLEKADEYIAAFGLVFADAFALVIKLQKARILFKGINGDFLTAVKNNIRKLIKRVVTRGVLQVVYEPCFLREKAGGGVNLLVGGNILGILCADIILAERFADRSNSGAEGGILCVNNAVAV